MKVMRHPEPPPPYSVIPPSDGALPPPDTTIPPSYSTIEPDDNTTSWTDERWRRLVDDVSLCGCGQRCTKNSCAKFAQVWFGFQSTEPQQVRRTGIERLLNQRHDLPAWRAIIFVYNRNVASLMQKAFSLSSRDFCPAESTTLLHEVHTEPVPLPMQCRVSKLQKLLEPQFASSWGTARSVWPYAQKFRVADSALGEAGSWPQWTGTLYVFSRNPSTVINFDVKSIANDSTVWGWALDTDGETVFDTRGGPRASFNTVFPGLRQWWSFPGDHHASTEAHEEGELER